MLLLLSLADKASVSCAVEEEGHENASHRSEEEDETVEVQKKEELMEGVGEGGKWSRNHQKSSPRYRRRGAVCRTGLSLGIHTELFLRRQNIAVPTAVTQKQ